MLLSIRAAGFTYSAGMVLVSVLQAKEVFEIVAMLAVEKNFLQALSPKV